MRLYFLRHGKAVARAGWASDDGLRPLTPDGEAAMVREARAMASLGLAPDVIVTSPLVRARRTAEITADALGVRDRLVEDARLAHGFSARRLAAILAAHAPQLPDAAVMLVGHEPELSAAVAELIGGGSVVLKKGGLARVDVADGRDLRGDLVWLLTPALLSGE